MIGERLGRPLARPLFCVAIALFPGLVLGDGNFGTTRVGDGVYQFRFESHNTIFVVTDVGVVAFDPLNVEAAAQYADEIQRLAPDQPLLAIVYSHHHDDHAAGAGVLEERFAVRPPIIAHDNARAPIVAARNPDVLPPDLTFSDRMNLFFGGRTIELRYLGKNHSDSMLVALVPDARTAFVVDFALHDVVGFRDLPDMVFPDQLQALERLRELDFDKVVFGHGLPGDKSSIDRQSAYYRDLWNAVESARRSGQSEDVAAATIRLPAYSGWRGYDEWLPLNVRAAYRWAAKEAGCR